MDPSSELENKPEDTPTIPPVQAAEGGVRAWCTVAGGWLALFATMGSATSFGIYQDLYVRAGTSTSSNVAWIGSVQLFFLISMGLPAGKLLDKGHFKPVILIGLILYVFSYLMLSFAHLDRFYQIFLAQGIGAGIGGGLIYTPSMAIQAHYWGKRPALAMGIVITGTSCGGIIFPVMVNNLLHGSAGFAWAVRAQALLTLGLLVPAGCLMSLPAQRPTQSDLPTAKFLVMLKDGPYMLMVFGSCLFTLGFFFPYVYLQLFSDSHNLPTKFSFYILTIQNGVSIFGRIIPNMIADKVGALNTLIIMAFATAVLIFAMFGLTNVGGVATFAALYGFFSGAVLSLFAPASLVFAQDISEIGLRMGISAFITAFTWLTGPPIAGALLSNSLDWSKAITFSGLVTLSSVPVMLIARYGQVRRRQTQRI